jgi:Pyridoxamine 5'-phosphate oxidase
MTDETTASTNEPRPGPVQIVDGYGLGDAPADGSALSWGQVVEWLTEARNYWICTTRKDGRPHAMPVWGLWAEDAVWFSTDPTSVKGRNLIERPDIVVHLESGDEVCILDGRVERIRDQVQRDRFDDRYDAKFDVRPSGMGDAAGVFVLRPKIALAWTEKDFPTTATRFAF